MDKIVERFNRDFAHWGIRLPRYAVKKRGRGKIKKAGWAIWYRFGVDARGEYLDYYSAHRMTDDQHTRVYEDGHIEILPTTNPLVGVTNDPDKNAGITAKICAKNQEIAAMLAEKGFGSSGEESGAIQITRFLRVWPKIEKPVTQMDGTGERSVMDLGPGAYTDEIQSEFIIGEIQFLTLQAALSTRNPDFPVYAKVKPKPDRTPFREALVRSLERVAIQYVPGRVSYREHYYYLGRFRRAMSSRKFKPLLHEGNFRVGVAQKALNLYLKYLWCLGEIAEPPHCPFDNLVIGELDDCEGINWTEFDDLEIYEYLVEQARIKAKDLSLAEWELRLFNRR